VLVDPDHIEYKNLNRILGSMMKHAYHQFPKVDIAQSNVQRIGLGSEVVAFPKSLFNAEVVRAIASTRPDTRMRQKTCLALDKLAQIANIEFDTKRYIGNYSPTKVSPRSLPTDSEIVEWYERLSNPALQSRLD
jgi:hypothetical protein